MCYERGIVKRFIKQQVLTLFFVSSVLMTGFGCAILLHTNCMPFRSLSVERGGQSVGVAVVLVFAVALITSRTSVYGRGSVACRALMFSHPMIVVINLVAMCYLPVRCVACLVLATASAVLLVGLWVLARFCPSFVRIKFIFWMAVVSLVFQLTFWLVIVLQG